VDINVRVTPPTLTENFEDIKGEDQNLSSKSKDRQSNGQKKKNKRTSGTKYIRLRNPVPYLEGEEEEEEEDTQ
jgi:hypothetical protein